jgi:hypothetical protein
MAQKAYLVFINRLGEIIDLPKQDGIYATIIAFRRPKYRANNPKLFYFCFCIK